MIFSNIWETEMLYLEQRYLMFRWLGHKWLLLSCSWLSFTKGLYGVYLQGPNCSHTCHRINCGLFLTGAKIQQQLAKIHNNVKKLQHQLKDVKPTPDCKKNSV